MTTSGWALRRIAEPLVEPVTLEEAKQQCLIDADITDQDTRIEGFIRGARELAEAYLKASICEQTWRLTLDAFPDDDIELPMGPVLSIASVKYYDTDGVQQDLTEDVGYQLNLDDDPQRIGVPIDGQWPTTQTRQRAIEIVYTAGYPSTGSPYGADGVPQAIKEAILSRVASRYNQREDQLIGPSQSHDTFGFERVLDHLRRYP
jgi:uncharacterized phiE125 gp8 family phage protein